MKHRPATGFIVGIASCLWVASATAGSCGEEIASFRQSLLRQEMLNPDGVGTAPQTIDAQLEHQPTRRSVERAKKQAKSGIATVLARAEKLDAEGKRGECLSALDTARLLLNP